MTDINIESVFVDIENRGSIFVPKGQSLLEIAGGRQKAISSMIVAAYVDNELRELNYAVIKDSKIRFITMRDEEGVRIYLRSLSFVMVKAVHELFPKREVIIQHSISKGLYSEVKGESELTAEEVKKIEDCMKEIIHENIPFNKRIVDMVEARQILTNSGRQDRYLALEHRGKECVTIYNCGNFEDYFYGYMVPDTGFINAFGLMFYKPGIILRFPEKTNPGELPVFMKQKKLFSIFEEHTRWSRILGVANVGSLNRLVSEGKTAELINVSEALHEKKIAKIADLICGEQAGLSHKPFVLIAGPSSSGKTTFAKRLSVQIRVNGFKPSVISMDNYFVNRDETPMDENGNYDYEAVEAIDVELFNKNLVDLLEGREVEIPSFNFIEGRRMPTGEYMRMDNDSILLIEGIHGMNDKLTSEIPADKKFKVYVSALTSMNIDDHNRIPTTDNRILRRMVRDSRTRGVSALQTLERWESVRDGERKHIFPFQEYADIMMNTAHVVELGVLKKLAEPLLKEIDKTSPYYPEAKRLLEFLSYFLPIDGSTIPANSIIREFIGEA